jgi:hypothetical protein
VGSRVDWYREAVKSGALWQDEQNTARLLLHLMSDAVLQCEGVMMMIVLPLRRARLSMYDDIAVRPYERLESGCSALSCSMAFICVLLDRH